MFFQDFCNVCNDSNIFNNILFACCLVSTIFYWFSLGFKNIKVFNTLAKITSGSATLSLFVFLLNRWIQFGYFPLSNLYESLLFLSCLLLLVSQALEYKIQSPLFGCIIVPIVLFITGFAALTLPLEMQKASALVPALQSNWLMMHVSLMMLSYAILIIGSTFAILYVGMSIELENYAKTRRVRAAKYEKHMIKTLNLTKSQFLCLGLDLIYLEEENIVLMHRTSFLYHIDNWSYRAISLGFPFLTIGIIAGAVWANEAWGSYWSWDPKETWALITWLIFAAYLHLRLIVGLNGKKPALLASIGFFVVWICYLGVNFLGQGLHSYGWFT